MRYIRFIHLILLLLVTVSCYDENTFRKQIDLPATQSKIVVFGYLSPENDTIRIYVGRSIALNDTVSTEDKQITNATVKLSCEGKTAILPWYDELRSYGSINNDGEYTPGFYYEGGYKIAVKDFPLISGKQVNLTVKTDMGTITSSCVIPEKETITPVLEKVWVNLQNEYYSEINANVIVKNFGGNQEYCHFIAEIGKTDLKYDRSWRTDFDIKTGNEFFIHKPTDASEVKYRLNKSYYNYQTVDTGEEKDSIYISLAKTDEAYYKFISTYKNYQDTDGNPFAEPVMIYSNIQGGLGVFCAYRLTKCTYSLRDYIN